MCSFEFWAVHIIRVMSTNELREREVRVKVLQKRNYDAPVTRHLRREYMAGI